MKADDDDHGNHNKNNNNSNTVEYSGGLPTQQLY